MAAPAPASPDMTAFALVLLAVLLALAMPTVAIWCLAQNGWL